jgi:hypothetical protein
MPQPFNLEVEDFQEAQLAINLLGPKLYRSKKAHYLQLLFLILMIGLISWLAKQPPLQVLREDQWVAVSSGAAKQLSPGLYVPSMWMFLLAPIPFALAFFAWSITPLLFRSTKALQKLPEGKLIRTYGGVERFRNANPNIFRQLLALVVFFGFISLPLWLVTTSSDVTSAPLALSLTLLPIYFLALGFSLTLLWSRISRTYQIRMREEAIKEIILDHRSSLISADVTGLTRNCDNFVSKSAWERFDSFAETENLFVLNLSHYRQVLVPKRGFSSAEEMAAFVDCLRRHIGNGWLLARSDKAMGFPVKLMDEDKAAASSK